MATEGVAPGGSLARSGSVVAPALLLLNIAQYALTVSAAHALDKDGYGELVALLGVLLVASVPGIALQAVVARAIVHGVTDVRGLLRRSFLVGVVLSLVTLAASPLLAAFLHTGVLGPVLVAAQLLPFAVLCGAMGVVQGQERFGALAVLLVVQSVGRMVAIAPLAVDGGGDAVLLVYGLGVLASAAFAVWLVGLGSGSGADLPGPRALASATGGLLSVLLLANLDVLLARNVLSGTESGRYAVGAVLAKAAFWLPQAVAVVVFPRLADPVEGRALLRKALLFVAGLGLVELVGCLLLAKPVLEIGFGTQYGSLSGIAWLWVVQGAALSVVQLLVYRAIATHDRVTGVVIGALALVEAIVVLSWQPAQPGDVIVVAAVIAAATTAALLARGTRV